jgi:hypothetical protein
MVSDFEGWPRLRDSIDRLNSTVCTPVELGYLPSLHTTSLEANGALANIPYRPQRRWIQPDIAGDPWGQRYPDPGNQIPTLGHILDGIRIGEWLDLSNIEADIPQGHLTLDYARWEHWPGEGTIGGG